MAEVLHVPSVVHPKSNPAMLMPANLVCPVPVGLEPDPVPEGLEVDVGLEATANKSWTINKTSKTPTTWQTLVVVLIYDGAAIPGDARR